MATRRSRLQVKPNIGGPKVGGAKPPPPLKIPDRSSKKADVGPGSPLKSPRGTSPIKSPRVTSPVKSPRVSSPVKSPRVTTPLKSPRVAYPIRGTTDKVASLVADSQASVQNNVSNQDITKSSNNENQNDNQIQNSKRGTEPSESSASTAEQTSQAPKRARLRRFGTVNVGLARGTKTANNESQIVNENTCEKEGQKIDRELGGGGKEAEEAVTDHVSSGLDEIGSKTNDPAGNAVVQQQELQQDKASNTDIVEDKAAQKEVDKAKQKPTTRARLPKAKPNFQDASRKRPKPSEENSAAGSDISQDSSALQLYTAPSASKTVGGSNTPDTPMSPVKHTAIQAKPTLPKSPQKSHVAHPLQLPPVKSGGKMYGDKDRFAKQRTVSMSEPHVAQPPPVKKVKLAMVDAPTDKPPDRGRMRMRDLIYWNPSSNPMKPKEKPAIEVKEKDKVKEKENTVQEPPPAEVGGEDEAMPVPQVTIGPDGNIVINEQSLVVKNAVEDKGPSQEDEPIDETEMFSTYGTFRKIPRSRRWSEKETAKFYKALAMVGIDFFLIQKMLPNRKRFELTKKFKKEERKNGHLIERVLKERLQFDESIFENVSSEEEDEKEIKKREQQEKKEQRKREREEKKKEAAEKKKKTSLRKKSNLTKNPYEPDGSSSDSEAERELAKNFRENPDVRETGKDKERLKNYYTPDASEPGGSKPGKDTEVVNILMDMSKGRLPGNDGVENVVHQNGVPFQFVNQSYADDTVTLTPHTSQQVYLNTGNAHLIANLQQSIPGIQNIITIEAQPLFPQGVEPSLTGNDLRAVADGQTTNNVIVQNTYPPYQIVGQSATVTSATISSQSELNGNLPQTEANDLTYIEMVNINQGTSQAVDQTCTVDSANQIYSMTSANETNQTCSVTSANYLNSANETYSAISADQVETVTSENQVYVMNNGNVSYTANNQINTINSANHAYTVIQDSALNSTTQAYKVNEAVPTIGLIAKPLQKATVSKGNVESSRKVVKTATGDIVEIEIVNDELEAIKTEVQVPQNKVHAVGNTMPVVENRVQAQARVEQAAESIMQALKSKLEAAKSTPTKPATPVIQSPLQPARSLLQAALNPAQTPQSPLQAVRNSVQPAPGSLQAARSPVQATQNIVQHARSPMQVARSPVQAAQSPIQVARSPMQAARSLLQPTQSPTQAAANSVQTPKSPEANILPSLGPMFNGNQIISQTLLSPESASRMPGLPQPGPNDQYVLVTVMPESGQETIIHVYRLHGGQQNQD